LPSNAANTEAIVAAQTLTGKGRRKSAPRAERAESMTWIDVASVALFVTVGVVEAKRGFFPAVIDLCLVLVGLNLAQTLTGTVASPLGSRAAAFGLLFLFCVVVAAVTSSLVDKYTKWEIGPYDGAAAGIVGVVVGLGVAHGLYHVVALHGAGGHALVVRSLLAPEIYDLRTLHSIGDMLRNLGSGPRISDQVRKSQQ
jgi:hypothetical protein